MVEEGGLWRQESESSDEAEEDRSQLVVLDPDHVRHSGFWLLPHTGEVGLRDTDAFALFCLEPPRPTFYPANAVLCFICSRIDYLQGLGCHRVKCIFHSGSFTQTQHFLWWGLPEHCRVLEEHPGLRPPDASSACLGCDGQKCLQTLGGGKVTSTESHCLASGKWEGWV